MFTGRELKRMIGLHGPEYLGVKADVAYTVVADAGNGLIKFTAAGHSLTKNRVFYIAGGNYPGYWRVKRVVDANNFLVVAAFVATEAGNLTFKAALDGYGFIVQTAPTIVEFIAEDPNFDADELIGMVLTAGQEINVPFKKMRISAGVVTVARRSPRASLTYTNT